MEIITKFKQLVDKYFLEHHDIAFYEEKIGLKPKYLSKLFKKINEEPPCQILLKKQIEHSEYLLKNSNLTIKSIAYELGYDDPYYFSRIFKNKTGYSPSQYRKTVTIHPK